MKYQQHNVMLTTELCMINYPDIVKCEVDGSLQLVNGQQQLGMCRGMPYVNQPLWNSQLQKIQPSSSISYKSKYVTAN